MKIPSEINFFRMKRKEPHITSDLPAFAGLVEWLVDSSVSNETYRTDRRTRKGQAARYPQLKLRPLRTGANEHATQRFARTMNLWRSL
jgi:hypothetical protein